MSLPEVEKPKLCPFCGRAVPFVQDSGSKRIDHYWIEHERDGCRLGGIKMYVPYWNTRPVEDSIAKEAASKAVYYAGFRCGKPVADDRDAQIKFCKGACTTACDTESAEKDEIFNLKAQLVSERLQREAAESSVVSCAQRVKWLSEELRNERRKGRGIH